MSNNQFPSADVQRLFEMEGDNLRMFSKIQGEFGDCILMSSIDLVPGYSEDSGVLLQIHQEPYNSPIKDIPFEFRLGEMHYFLQIASLFNPKNRTDYGLPQTQTDLP